MKKIFSFLILICLPLLSLNAQNLDNGKNLTPGNSADGKLIVAAALDYAEGYYTGDVSRMERALNPALIKRGLLKISKNGSPVLVQMNAETLIEAVRNNTKKTKTSPEVKASVLEINGPVATARVFTPYFNDYLHFVKQNGQWKLTNVLWCPPVEAETDNKEAEEGNIIDAINEYFTAARNGDTELLSKVIYADLMKRTYMPSSESGKYFLRELNAETLTETVRAGMVKLPEGATEIRPQVLDLYENIASAKVTIGNITDYLHLAKQNGQWRIVNGLAFQNN